MKKVLVTALLSIGMLCLGHASVDAQGRVMDEVAQRVITKYQSTPCAELEIKRGQPPSPMEERAVRLLREDPQMRAAFLNRVAGPIANKMFECGMIP